MLILRYAYAIKNGACGPPNPLGSSDDTAQVREAKHPEERRPSGAIRLQTK
jgi:hypothetical protein